MTFPLFNILRKASNAVSKAGSFDGTKYGLIGGSFSLPTNWEFTIGFTPTELTPLDFDSPFGQHGTNRTFKIEYRSSNSRYNFRISNSGFVSSESFNPNSYTPNVYTELKVTYINGVIRTYFNDNLSITASRVLTVTTIDALHIGAEEFSPTGRRLNGTYSKMLFNELNTGGSPIANLIELDWNNGDINTVPNIGSDAPVGSDMSWVPAGSGIYI